jgi:hypothetical protein
MVLWHWYYGIGIMALVLWHWYYGIGVRDMRRRDPKTAGGLFNQGTKRENGALQNE